MPEAGAAVRRWVKRRGRRPARVSQRMRRPQPLLKQRMPSGRGAMEQPNITSGGAGVLTPRFWVMVVLTGIAAGLLGALMMAILFNVGYAAFGYHSGSFQHGAGQAPAVRRVASLLIAGASGGVAGLRHDVPHLPGQPAQGRGWHAPRPRDLRVPPRGCRLIRRYGPTPLLRPPVPR